MNMDKWILYFIYNVQAAPALHVENIFRTGAMAYKHILQAVLK